MPAAAVIPAAIAYIKVVAVKKLVVGFLPRTTGPLGENLGAAWASSWRTKNKMSSIKVANTLPPRKI